MPLTPVVVNDSFQNGTTGGPGNQMYGPYAIGVKLYVPLANTAGGNVQMGVSLDNGLTWNSVAGPACSNFACSQDGLNLVAVLNNGGAISIAQFNTTSDSWVVLPGTVSPANLLVITGLQCFAPGSYWMLTASDDLGGNILYDAYPYTAGAFGAPIDLTVNFSGTAFLSDGVHETSCFDAGLIHCFFAVNDSVDGVSHYYQSFDIAGVLQSNFRFESIPPPDVLQDGETGQPVAYSGMVVWPCNFIDTGTGTAASQIYVGTPDTAPVWAGPFPVDPTNNPSLAAGRAALAGADIVITFSGSSTAGDTRDAIIVCTTPSVDPTTGWTSAFALDGTTPPVDFNSITGANPAPDILGGLAIIFDATNTTSGLPGSFILSNPVAPVLIGGFIPLSGGGIIEEQCCPPEVPKPRCVDDFPPAPSLDDVMVQSLFRHQFQRR